MKYQRILLNVLIPFFLFFNAFVQAEGDVEAQKESIEKYLPALTTGMEASGTAILYSEEIAIKLGPFIKGRDTANGLDRLINSVKVFHSAYNHDLYSTVKNIIDAHASTFLAGSASTLAMGGIGLFTVSNPLIIGGGIIAGVGTAIAYSEIDPIKIIVDGIEYESYNDIYNNAENSLLSCDLNNANKQIHIATQVWLKLLDKSNAKCISIKSMRNKYMKKHNIQGLNPKHTVMFSTQSEKMIEFKLNLQSAEKIKKEHFDFLVKLLNFKRDLRKNNEEFKSFSDHYIQQLSNIKNDPLKDEACRNYNLLRAQNECAKVFLETSAPSLQEEKKKLAIEMNNLNHELSLNRWNTLEKFYEKLQCSNLDSIQKKLMAFEEMINKNTIKVYDDIQCYSPTQSTFHNKLNDFKAEWQEEKYECNQIEEEKRRGEAKKRENEQKVIAKKECPDYLIKQKRREIKKLIERLNTQKKRIQNGTISFHVNENSSRAREKRSLLRDLKDNQSTLKKKKSKGNKAVFSLPRGPNSGEWGHSKFNLEKDLQRSKTDKHYIYYKDQKHISYLHKKIRQWHEAKEKYIDNMLANIAKLQNYLKVWEKKANKYIKNKEAEIQKLRDELENCL